MPWPVLLMARELNLGGSERQMTEIAKSLDRSRFEPHVGCFRPEGMRGEELRAAGIPVIDFPVYSYMSPAALRAAAQLAAYIRRHRIRIVHTWDYPLNVFAVPVARLFTSSVAISSQRAHRELTPSLYKHLQHLSDRLTHAIVVNCKFLQKHLEQDEKIPPHRIHLCYNGIDLDRFRALPAMRRPSLQDTSLVIGTVCALRPEKSLPTLLQSFAAVRRLREGMKLAIVGSGSMLGELQSLASTLGIAADCVFEPATEQVAEWLQSIDIFVLPSRTEAFSNSIMEAMACGRAVIASNVGGNPELVKDGATGLLFEAEDAAGLAASLTKLIENENLRLKLAAAGQRMIHESFSNAASARRMAEIYEDLIARTHHAGPLA